MSESAPATSDSATRSGSSSDNKIYLVSYPKVILMYPTLIAALAAAIYTMVRGENTADTELVSIVFLGVFTINFIVLAFDFPRTTSLTLLFLGAAVVMGFVLLFKMKPDLLPVIGDIIKSIKPYADSQFYLCLFTILTVIFILVFLSVQFDYWEVRPNELLHHHGFLSNLKRYPTRNIRIEKEITDVFEYLLLRSGRLIIYAENEQRAIVLDNVPWIGSKEDKITKLLGALQVQVRQAP
ncbi:hypothetical protein [Calycomorphotria hydatis]|uniref:Uncharacterized protein n=1 Tax=Calycomorphotria hydatis TaxID=2528027 RepID=A0A517T812_9PLAN|nr:hypothetical protein [Calycomorphotria hydatis]QDT64516.1 hypothetical protein V22_17510 [Calycomorphotria hydatis]